MRLDHETPTVEAAAVFERDREPDWDLQLAAEEARRGSFPRPEVADEPSTRPRRPEWDDLW